MSTTTLEQFIMGTLPTELMVLFFLVIVWSLAWKGVALWKAARLYHKGWFVAILLFNFVGLLEIFYIFFIARKEEREEITEEA